jgi:hypothetical protein
MLGLIIFILSVIAASCASPYKANDLSDNMKISELKGNTSQGVVGLNEKKEIVVQEEISADTELQVQRNVNLHWLETLEHEAYFVKWCRRDLADPRLGGYGELPADPEIDNIRTPEQVREEMGLDDDGNLKIVKQSYFADKLKKERAYGEAMQKMITLFKRHRDECEWKMGQARAKAGLPSTRYIEERLENGLDTAFSKKGVKHTIEGDIKQIERAIVQRDERG